MSYATEQNIHILFVFSQQRKTYMYNGLQVNSLMLQYKLVKMAYKENIIQRYCTMVKYIHLFFYLLVFWYDVNYRRVDIMITELLIAYSSYFRDMTIYLVKVKVTISSRFVRKNVYVYIQSQFKKKISHYDL